jgi:hypothetical protein
MSTIEISTDTRSELEKQAEAQPNIDNIDGLHRHAVDTLDDMANPTAFELATIEAKRKATEVGSLIMDVFPPEQEGDSEVSYESGNPDGLTKNLILIGYDTLNGALEPEAPTPVQKSTKHTGGVQDQVERAFKDIPPAPGAPSVPRR